MHTHTPLPETLDQLIENASPLLNDESYDDADDDLLSPADHRWDIPANNSLSSSIKKVFDDISYKGHTLKVVIEGHTYYLPKKAVIVDIKNAFIFIPLHVCRHHKIPLTIQEEI